MKMTPVARPLISPQALNCPATVLQLRYRQLPGINPRHQVLFALRLEKKRVIDTFLGTLHTIARNSRALTCEDQARHLLFHLNDFLASLEDLLHTDENAGTLLQADDLREIQTCIHQATNVRERLYEQYPAFKINLLASASSFRG